MAGAKVSRTKVRFSPWSPFPTLGERPPLRRTIPLLALLACLIVPGAAQAAWTKPGPEPGLNIAGGVSVTDEQVQEAAATGTQWVRHFLFLDDFDVDSQPSISRLAKTVQTEKRLGLKTMFVVANATHEPPANPQDWANRLARFARGMAGTNTIAYEIWNEQDEGQWWRPAPNATTYVDLLKRAYAGVKSVDPSATVLMGPTTGNNYDFIKAAYDAGAKGSFDGVGVHTDTACLIDSPYKRLFVDGKENRYTFLGIKEVRKVMVANGDADKGVWVTEMGWMVSSATCPVGQWAGKKAEGVTPAKQAQFMLEGFHCLAQEGSYVKAALWYTDRDAGYGLFDAGNAPALAAFKSYTAEGDKLTDPCGDFVAPQIEVVSPQPRQMFAYKSKVPVRVKTTGGDTRSISVVARLNDGSGKIAGWSNDPSVAGDYTTVAPIDFAAGKPCKDVCAADWSGFYKPANGDLKRVPPGGATLVVTAVDDPGNASTVEVPISIVPPGKLPAVKAKYYVLKISGKGRTRRFQVQIAPEIQPALAPVKGALFVEWQNLRRGKWKKIHGGGKVANRGDRNLTMTFVQKLKYGGRWRVRAVYPGRSPYAPVKSKWVKFRA